MSLTDATRACDHIAVCVCTYQRPELLDRLLECLCKQETQDRFTFELVVVENDQNQQCASLVQRHASKAPVRISYACEPRRNISLARNRAIAAGSGNLIAMIDDDETPGPQWLYLLHQTLVDERADGVLGPVVPDLPPAAPAWLRRGRICERPRHKTGTLIGSRDSRTGNLLMRRDLVTERDVWFDPALGRTGGEDSDFFARQRERGRKFVWCDEAIVTEVVPPERWSAGFHLKRMWRSGTISGGRVRSAKLPYSFLGRTVLLLAAYAAMVPATVVMPKHLRMRVAMKVAYCTGVVGAGLGLCPLRVRD